MGTGGACALGPPPQRHQPKKGVVKLKPGPPARALIQPIPLPPKGEGKKIVRPRRGACGASHIRQAGGLISTAWLSASPRVHLPPIELVVFQQALGES